MILQAGTRLGPYEVVSLLGAGGMGEVYRARDTKLGRDVALKILPDALAGEPERLARFEREARTLASLNHPNIAAIYGFEESAGTRALVMELVEGPTLAELIDSGPPEAESVASRLRDGASAAGRESLQAAAPGVGPRRPERSRAPRGLRVDDALPIARQIADALEAAHEHGIIHRDLKPANIKVREDGTVKVLDFGLAKAMDTAGAPASSGIDSGATRASSNAQTMTSPALTAQGFILGTAAYMAPEQARGRSVDRRADIWAFGCVMFEMLAGRRLFEGETVSDTLAAVLRQEVPWDRLPASTPDRIRRLLERCLDRDPRTRLRDIGEARVMLERGPEADGKGPSAMVMRAPRSAGRERLAWAVAVVAVTGLAAVWWAGRSAAPAARWDTFTQITDEAGQETNPSLSPDGTSVAYASRVEGSWNIYVRRVGGRNPVLVAGDPARDEDAPAFSPDGTLIAFHEADADGGIFVVGATGESARRLTNSGFHPAWSPDGRRLVFCTEAVGVPYSRGSISSLWVAEVGGGEPRKIYDGDAVQPAWSPSGARVAFWAADQGQRDLFTIPAEGGERVAVLVDSPLDWNPVWSPDGRYLYFASDRGGSMNLWRIAINETTGASRGAPEPITSGVQTAMEQPRISADGARLVFRATLSTVNPIAIPLDAPAGRLGSPRHLFRRTGILIPTSVSPDGQWLALASTGERLEDVFICRTDGSGLRRLTDDAARDRVPVWSPDGQRVTFYSNRSGRYEIWTIGRDGGGLTKLTGFDDDLLFPVYAPAGDRLVASAFQRKHEVVVIDPRRAWADQTPGRFPSTVPNGILAPYDWSPDGRRLVGKPFVREGFVFGFGVYDLETQAVRMFEGRSVLALAWLADSRRVLLLTDDDRFVIHDVVTDTRRELTMATPVRFAGTDRMAIAPDNRTIFAGAAEVESDLWMVQVGANGPVSR